MRITEASFEPLRLELLRPLKTARALYTAREGFVVRLKDEEGREGLGEAMPLEAFGTESPGACEQALRESLSLLRGRELPESPWGEGFPSRGPAANHALEQALLDLLAQRRGVPLSLLLSSEAREDVEVNALLGAETPEALAEEAKRAVAEGYRTLKLKVAGRPLEEDEARLAAVRRAAGPEIRLRVDANGGWREGEVGRALDRLGRHQLELCEQPVEAEAYASLGRLQARAPCPLAADEALSSPEAVRALLESTPRVGLLVLKPMVLGGLLRALSLAHQARERGMDAYVTSSLDGVVARAGATHLAAALPSGKHASGLAVGHLFKDEPTTHPFRPERGRIRIPRVPGLGVR